MFVAGTIGNTDSAADFVITDNPTGPDMFVVGLGVDGSDLSGFPGARPMATPSTRRAFMKPSAADLGLKDAGSSP